VIALVGHFGSGKTEIAVNLGLTLAETRQVTLVDLDVVKPYFRLRLARDAVMPRGIRLIAPEGELGYSDLPILLPEVAGSLRHGHETTILDVGGDESGARVLGALGHVLAPLKHDLLFVVNTRRPSTEDGDAVLAVMGEIEGAARLRVTGLIANTHLMDETTVDDIREGIEVCRNVERRSGRPLRFACAEERFAEALGDVGVPLLPLRRHIVPLFLKRPMRTTLAV